MSDESDDSTPTPAQLAAPEDEDRWLTPGVVGVGTASLLSDTGHELATSLLPTFLQSTLHAGPGVLGIIEGVADALTGVSKLLGGPIADDPARRGRAAASGYVGTAVATAAIGLATAVWQVGVLRATAWIARGLRSPSRDALLVSLAGARAYGRAVGLERAGDNLGAVLGPLLAAGLISVLGIRTVLLLTIVPGLGAAVAIMVAARAARAQLRDRPDVGRSRRTWRFDELREAGFALRLLPMALFELGNLAATLLILRATDLLGAGGMDLQQATTVAVVLYAGHNAVAALGALVGGRVADRLGSGPVLAASAGCYVAGYALFATSSGGWPMLLLAFALAGCGIGAGETAQSTAVARALPDRLRGTGYGTLGLVQAVGDIGATVVAGLLWASLGATAAFGYAVGWMSLCLVSVLAVPALRRSDVHRTSAGPNTSS